MPTLPGLPSGVLQHIAADLPLADASSLAGSCRPMRSELREGVNDRLRAAELEAERLVDLAARLRLPISDFFVHHRQAWEAVGLAPAGSKWEVADEATQTFRLRGTTIFFEDCGDCEHRSTWRTSIDGVECELQVDRYSMEVKMGGRVVLHVYRLAHGSKVCLPQLERPPVRWRLTSDVRPQDFPEGSDLWAEAEMFMQQYRAKEKAFLEWTPRPEPDSAAYRLVKAAFVRSERFDTSDIETRHEPKVEDVSFDAGMLAEDIEEAEADQAEFLEQQAAGDLADADPGIYMEDEEAEALADAELEDHEAIVVDEDGVVIWDP